MGAGRVLGVLVTISFLVTARAPVLAGPAPAVRLASIGLVGDAGDTAASHHRYRGRSSGVDVAPAFAIAAASAPFGSTLSAPRAMAARPRGRLAQSPSPAPAPVASPADPAAPPALPPTAAPVPAAAPPAPVVLLKQPPPPSSASITDKWWFWAGIGGVVVLTATVLLVATRGEDEPKTKLGNMEAFK